jgi:hypothetical protein
VWAPAADHRDGPIFINTAANGQQDINDVYIFNSPATPSNTVIAMTVQPFPGLLTPATFATSQYYDIKVDNTGDAVEDITFRLTVSAPNAATGVQTVTLRGLPSAKFPPTGILAQGPTGQTLPIRGGGMFMASTFDDPFFFDAQAFSDLVSGKRTPGDPNHPYPRPAPGPGVTDPARNFFFNANTLGFIIEMPTTRLLSSPTNTKIGVFGRIERNGVQVDRMGRPAINTALIPPIPRNSGNERRNAFNAGLPVNDRRDFRNDMMGIMLNVYKLPQATASGLADFLLPDILTFDASKPFNPAGGFPNGRQFRDPVIHIELGLLTQNAITTDNVNDDNGTLITDGTHGTVAKFPYFGPPNNPQGGPNP